jgi:branched-chain amino acid transport system substrate-binding protein
MPLTGDYADFGIPLRDAVKLAVDRVNADGGVAGTRITLDERDHGGDDGERNADRGAENVTAMAADPRIVAMVGPWNTPVARAEIPITNEAGLLQCSPTNSYPELTKPRNGALDLRRAHPERINYIRTSPSDDIQGTALAAFILRDLGIDKTLVVDDTGIVGRTFADEFQNAYSALGGRVVRRALNPGSDPRTVLDSLSAKKDPPRAVFFGGFADQLPTFTSAPALRKAMAAEGHGKIPFLMYGDAPSIVGSGATPDSYLKRTGKASAGTYMSHASIGLPEAVFTEAYRAAYGREPDEYAAAAYACTEVIVEALRAAAKAGTSPDGLREAVRAYAIDPAHRFETVIGTVGFDANGDSRQQFVTFYRVDPSAAGGKGDWVIVKQQDYGPAP